ncbi:hypothetical protein [Inquilinus sp.]|jgi:hypothetical protein|uniref:hypothetical protein n=1 Tax=Inquilinus sp. TaxID=1932117 RepID=UPI003783C159
MSVVAIARASWTPRGAAKASRSRIDRMESMLEEIADLWGTADGVIVDDCDRVKAELKNLRAAVEYAGEKADG